MPRLVRTALYLAVVSHGSSGYPRSALFIFESTGRLVWKEELNRVQSVIAVPSPDQTGAVLLVGGMDGVLEYSLGEPAPSDTAEKVQIDQSPSSSN